MLMADFLSPRLKSFPASMVSALSRWWPIRFEQMATVLITDCVHTPRAGDCTRAPSRWCESNHPRVALADHQKEEANLMEEATFSEQCKKSVRDDYVRPFNQPTCSMKMFKLRVPPLPSKRPVFRWENQVCDTTHVCKTSVNGFECHAVVLFVQVQQSIQVAHGSWWHVCRGCVKLLY